MLHLAVVVLPLALGLRLDKSQPIATPEPPETDVTTVTGCEPLPSFQQDTSSTKAGLSLFNPPMTDGLMATNFSCDPLPDHNLTMVTSFSSFFGGTPFLYVSPAHSRWELELKCNPEQGFWFHEELVEDILYHIKFYKIRCNSFLFTDVSQMDHVTEELKKLPFP